MGSSSLVIGFHAVEELLKGDVTVSKVFVNSTGDRIKTGVLRAMCKEKDVPLQMVPMIKLNNLSRKNHQGVIAITSPIEFVPLEETVTRLFEEGEPPKIVIADGIHDVRNIGAIGRSCLAFGVDLLIIGSKSNADISEAAIKTSAGALLQLPVCRVPSIQVALEYLKSWGLIQIGASEKASDDIQNIELTLDSWCLWLGNEDKGLSRERLAQMDKEVAINLDGRIDSLNVSVAAGIILYQLTR